MKPKPNLPAFLIAAILVAHAAQNAPAVTADIPDRPEKLSFPELNYQPPDPAQFRVPLQSGPVAYVAPDRELPLVNLSILVRTGYGGNDRKHAAEPDFTFDTLLDAVRFVIAEEKRIAMPST